MKHEDLPDEFGTATNHERLHLEEQMQNSGGTAYV